jgi:hypothetical protein
VLSPVSAYLTADFNRPLVRRSSGATRSVKVFCFFVAMGFLTGAERFLDVGDVGDVGVLLWTLLFGFNGFGLRGAYGQMCSS